MAELVVKTSLDRSGFDKGVTDLKAAITTISSTPIKIKVEGDVSKVTASIAKIVAAQEKSKQAVEATKQAQLAANASMAESYAKILVAQEKSNQEHDKALQKTEQRAAAVANLNREMEHNEHWEERQAHAEEQHATATERRVTAEANKERQTLRNQQAEKDLERAEVNRETAAIRAGAQSEAAARRAAAATNELRDSVTSVSEAFTGWAKRTAWNAIYNGLRQSLNVMKEMDSYLNTIQRVSGADDATVAQYQQRAYEVSSTYGVKPTDYLENVTAFTRAGYGQLAPELAEVATKMQVVGGVSSETATQMLLAADAAYKFGDNMDAWSATLDGVVAIGDNYATNIEKISEGIGIVAPVASQAHVSIEELSAAIGTITTVTQRSGTEAARALRSLFLNIMGDTKTEIEDGVTWTEDEIKSFRDVLMTYIPDVMAEADIEGKVINPMKAIGALAQAVKDEKLNEQDLVAMVGDLGGKLRSSQLLALIQNFDMYSDMVKLFGDSFGETDSKVDIALQSWESKANMLSASFTKLFSDVLNSGAVKGGIDVLRGFVDILDIGGGAPAKVLALGAAFSVLSGVMSSFANGGKLASALSSLTSFFTNPAFLAGAAVATAFVGIKAIVDEIVVTQEELDEKAQTTAQTYTEQKAKTQQVTDELKKHRDIISELVGKSGRLTGAEQARLDKEREITAELERHLKLEKQKEEKAARESAEAAAKAGLGIQFSEQGVSDYLSTGRADVLDLSSAYATYQLAGQRIAQFKAERDAATDLADIEELDWYIQQWTDSQSKAKDYITEQVAKLGEYYKTVSQYIDDYGLAEKSANGELLTTTEQSMLAFVDFYKNTIIPFYEQMFPRVAEGQDGSGGTGGGSSGGGSTSTQSETAWQKLLSQREAQTKALTKANDDYNRSVKDGQKYAEISKETYEALTAAGIDLKDSVVDNGDAYVITREALDGLIKSCKDWHENYGIEMPEDFKDIADGATETSSALADLIKNASGMADETAAASKALADLKAQLKDGGEHGDTLSAYRTEYKTVMEMYEKGLYGSRELQGFTNLVLGDEIMARLGYDYQKAGELMGSQFFKAMFNPEDKDDFGKQALKYMWKNLTDGDGNVVDENGKVVASFKEVDGQLDVSVQSFEGLAKVLGMNKDVLVTLFDALGMYKNGLNNTGDDITNLLDKMGSGISQVKDGAREVDLNKFINTLAAEGSTVSEIYGLIKSMRGMDGIKLLGDTANPEDIIKSIQDAVHNANNKDLQLAPDASGFESYADKAKAAINGVNEAWAAASATINGSKPTPSMDTSEVQAGAGALNGAVGVAENYQSVVDGVEPTPGMDTSEVLAGTGAVNGATGTLERYQTTGKGAKPKPGMDTSGVTNGENTVKRVLDLLVEFGGIDESAKAGIETKLAAPEAAMAVATALLLAFGWIDEDAKASIDASQIDGPKQTVAEAKKYLETQWGITFPATATLDAKIPADKKMELGAALVDLWAFGKTFTATTTLTGDATDAEKAAALKAAADDVTRLKGEFDAHCKILGLDPVDAGAAKALADSLNSLKSLYETKVEIDTSGIADAQKLLDELETKAGEIAGAMQETIQGALTPGEESSGVEPTGSSESSGTGRFSSRKRHITEQGSEAPESTSAEDSLKAEVKALNDAALAWLVYDSAVGEAHATVSEGVQDTEEYWSDDEDLERMRRVADNIRNLQDQAAETGWSEDAKQALSIYSEYLDLFSEDTIGKMKEQGWNEWFDARDALNEALASVSEAPEAEESVGAVEGLSDALDGLPESAETEVGVPGCTEATGEVDGLAGALSGLPETQTVNLVVRSHFAGIASGGILPASFFPSSFIPGKAEGTRDFPGGQSVVNEKGPELISANGKAFIANGGAPTIVDLPKGAVIFTAEETKSIVAGHGFPAGGSIAAHAGGKKDKKPSLSDFNWSVWDTATINNTYGPPAWYGSIDVDDKDDKTGNGGKKPKGPEVDNTDYWAIVEAHYKDVTATADMAMTNLKYQIDLLKDAWDDEKKPLDEQIEALQELNKVIDRQITLLGRERDKLTKPIQDEVDALKDAKDIQDDQLELAERQKAVEEARAELQNAQNERTIRFYNKETGHWEWMADQKRVQDAQKSLEDAEKSLADFEFDLKIKGMEAEIKAIEDEYQTQIDALNADKTANEDTIYDLQQQLKALELKYEALIQPLEDEQEDRERASAAIKNAWANAEELRREGPEGNLAKAISKTGEAGAIAGGGINELKADLKTIANAYKPAAQNNTLASLGIQFGASSGIYNPANVLTSIAGNTTDSHNIIINGITMPASAAYQSLMDLVGDLAIYAGE